MFLRLQWFFLMVLLSLNHMIVASPQLNKFIEKVGNVAGNVMDQWIKFKLDNFKQFSPEEDAKRFNIFKQNLEIIDNYRKKFLNGEISFQVGINQFTHLTKAEFLTQFLTLKPPQRTFQKRDLSSRSNRTTRQVPAYVDWRNTGAVTSVKDQKDCASCWAFSAVGSLESQYFLRTGNLVSMSEQNLIDCTNDGCSGGWMGNAFQYLSNNKITSESEYGYSGTRGTCNFRPKQFGLSIKGFQTIPGDEFTLQQMVASVGPVSAAIDASNLQFYAGGIFRDDECSKEQVNHGILVVGYGSEGGRDYWLIKNSWGSKWGEDGYFKLIRNKANECNIASYAMYPLL
ncbi:procathepsin L-like [Anthonomus grandis grandis]|uniref:procathepsin L-like n=1 Tax=Anthonomus grandis grandis TaxID=2921223 RepID=UPI0021668EFE|nr:procathepsin L-like [Anthonomus grandis grandis]